MPDKTTILLKLTGATLSDSAGTLACNTIRDIAQQLVRLAATHQFGIVIGGGNLFRGNQHGAQLGISAAARHDIGMVATLMNGLIIRDIFAQAGIDTIVCSAITCPQLSVPIATQTIADAKKSGKTIIFVGGTGNPFLTTDTCAIIRALQIGASAVWKGTTVDGIYTQDPRRVPNATKIARISYHDIISQRLGIMDMAAYGIAQEYGIPIRIFNIFTPDILVNCAQTDAIGSIIT